MEQVVTKHKIPIAVKQMMGEFTLFKNVQFIYELALTKMELESFGVCYQIDSGMRYFHALNAFDENAALKRTAYFEKINGKNTDYSAITRRNRTRSVNQYLTHWIYPYKGKFHPQMIRALLNIIGATSGNTILDPFIGSGTTALEAQLLGINCIGIDVSPLCILQSKVKTESIYVINELKKLRGSILWN